MRTRAGNLLWDPTGYLDDHAVALIRELGEVVGIVAIHMFGVRWTAVAGGNGVLSSGETFQANPDRASVRLRHLT